MLSLRYGLSKEGEGEDIEKTYSNYLVERTVVFPEYTQEYIRRIPPSVPPGSERAFSDYILPSSH
jgi:hypothetical protein